MTFILHQQDKYFAIFKVYTEIKKIFNVFISNFLIVFSQTFFLKTSLLFNSIIFGVLYDRLEYQYVICKLRNNQWSLQGSNKSDHGHWFLSMIAIISFLLTPISSLPRTWIQKSCVVCEPNSLAINDWVMNKLLTKTRRKYPLNKPTVVRPLVLCIHFRQEKE